MNKRFDTFIQLYIAASVYTPAFWFMGKSRNEQHIASFGASAVDWIEGLVTIFLFVMPVFCLTWLNRAHNEQRKARERDWG